MAGQKKFKNINMYEPVISIYKEKEINAQKKVCVSFDFRYSFSLKGKTK
jgi:hypothetical protein